MPENLLRLRRLIQIFYRRFSLWSDVGVFLQDKWVNRMIYAPAIPNICIFQLTFLNGFCSSTGLSFAPSGAVTDASPHSSKCSDCPFPTTRIDPSVAPGPPALVTGVWLIGMIRSHLCVHLLLELFSSYRINEPSRQRALWTLI